MTKFTKKLIRPKGCPRTISGRHWPTVRIDDVSYDRKEMTAYCKFCGLVDDIGFFSKYLGWDKLPKINDEEIK